MHRRTRVCLDTRYGSLCEAYAVVPRCLVQKVTPTFAVMLSELERALDEAWEHRDDPERAHELAEEALVSFLRSMTMAIPSAPQRGRLAAVLDRYESLPR